jgi:cystathionine gamma-synthase
LRTLAVRLERQQQSAAILAERLAEAAGVKAVHYPGLTTHPSRAIAARQQAGFGAMLSFELEDRARAPALAESVKRLTLAESLGGIESLICHPATMTHAAMSAEARSQAGITDGLIRISAGLEHVEDLWTDLQAALQTSRQRASAA